MHTFQNTTRTTSRTTSRIASRTRSLRRALAAGALGLSVAVAASACGNDTTGDTESSSSSSSDTGSGSGAAAPVAPSATEHNDADVAFASDMLQHHAQALTMVDMTTGRTLSPEVAALAEQIRAAQSPEIEIFTGWLTQWDEPVPATGTDSTGSADEMEGMASMEGMMSADDMASLDAAPDDEFETLWLQMMVEHHLGAVSMAKSEAEAGQYQPALDLAESITTSQTEEIATMENLLQE